MRDFKGMKRQRGRNRGGGAPLNSGKPQQNANRAFDSSGPENVKVRGHAQSVYEKYQQLARDAFSSGDRVLAEGHLQHAEHYFRLLRLIQPNRPTSEIVARDVFAAGVDIDFEDESGAEALPDVDASTPADAPVYAQGEGGAEARDETGEGGRDRPRYEDRGDRNGRFQNDRGYQNDRQGGDRAQNDRGQNDRQDRPNDRYQGDRQNGRGQNDRTQQNDRPQGERGQNDRPYNDRGYNNDRNDRYQADRPRNDRQNEGRFNNDRPREERSREERPQADRGQTDRSQGDRVQADRVQGDRPREDRPRGDRVQQEREGRRDRSFDRNDSERPEREDRAYGDASAAPAATEPPVPATPYVPERDTPSATLRSEDGGVSEAPAFLQASLGSAASTPVPADEEVAPARRPRTRTRRRTEEVASASSDGAPESAADDA